MAVSLNTRLALAFLVALVASLAFVIQTPTPTLETYKPVDIQLTRGNTAIENFAAAIQCPTVGDEFAPNHVTNPGPFKQLHGVLQAAYPGLWKTLTVEKVSSYSLLFTWTGSNPTLAPVLLISHQDVVPAPPANWTHDPFSGLVEDGFLYGRGTLDTKGSMMAILEGMEELRSSGWTPTRTLLFAAGHDEELGGKHGAGQISALLASRYPSLEVVLDEGGFLMADGLGPSTAGVLRPLRFAVVGLAEKGTTTWDLEVRGQGGHSSLPPPAGNTISARLGNLLGKVDATEPPARLQSPTLDFLKAMAPHAKHAPLSWLLRNAGAPVLRTVLAKLIGKSAAMGFMVRTVRGVVTVQAGGHAHNVLPTHANVTVNFRPIQGDGYDEVVSYLHTVTAGIRGHVTMTERPGSRAPSLVTPASGKHFALVRRAALETLTQTGAGQVPPPPPLDVLPYVMSGATDSRHYQTLAPGRVLRFEPFHVYHADLARLHSLNERISCEAFLDGIKFYVRFMQLAAGSGTEAA